MPGVIAAYSGKDLEDVMGASMPCAWPVTPDMVSPVHTPLAIDEVRYVGDGVAVVIARDRYSAADALEAITVEYEQLPAVVDMEEALKEGSPLVHEDKGTNKCFLFDFPGAGADFDETVAAAADAVVVKRRFRQQRLLPTPMEPRAVVVAPIAAADEFTVQLPAVVDMEVALAEGAPLVHSDKGTNRCFLFDFPAPAPTTPRPCAAPVTTRSWCAAASASSACCPCRWSPAASSSPPSPRPTSTRCGRPRRSRTSCA